MLSEELRRIREDDLARRLASAVEAVKKLMRPRE